MSLAQFEAWFKKTFGRAVPEEYKEVLSEHPSGVIGDTAQLYALPDVVAFTEEREEELLDKGVCLIGDAEALTHILLRVADGKVFIVDRTNYKIVDATFKSTVSLQNLLALDG